MEKKVLITYASVSGSTGEVAEAIGKVLTARGAAVQVSHVRDVSGVVSYNAVVLGSSIRSGQWLPGALQFLDAFRSLLSYVPVAYFTTCLALVNDTEDDRRMVLAYMESVLQYAPEVKPVGLGLFAGSLEPGQQLPSTSTLKISQGDYRNWKAINTWAAEVAPALLAETKEPDQPVIRRDATLSYGDMPGVDLPADLHQAGFNWSDLDWDNMNEVDLSGANLVGADLSEVELNRANLSHAILNGANLSRAGLRNADLRYADLNWADLRGADLSHANLSWASLSWANLSRANLEYVDLTNTRYNHQTRWPENFSAQEHSLPDD